MKSSSLLVVVVLLASWPAVPTAQSQSPIQIGIVLDGDWHRNEEILRAFREEILALTEGEFEVRFPPSKVRDGGWTLGGVRTALDQLLADPEVDLILAAGVLASDDACRRGPLVKPIVAPAVIDPEMQGLPDRNGTSGIRNLCYLTLPSTIRRDVQTFKTITPFTRLVVLMDRNIAEAIPEAGPRIDGMLEGLGVTITSVAVGSSVAEIWSEVPPDAEAVYLYPLRQLSLEAFQDLVDGLIARGLPSFSFFGETDVRRGVLAGLNPDIFPRLSRRVALNVQRILLGEEAANIPTAFSAGERLMINDATARALGKYPSWAVVTEAVLVGEEKTPAARHWNLIAVMEEALAANLDLASRDRAVASGRHEVGKARSRLLPQVDLSASGVVIDEDRAGPVTQAQRTLGGSARLSQVLFSDQVLAGFSAQRHLQDSRIAGREALRLDVVQEAATAYLEVLRAMTLEEIQKENLTLSRQNLELARVRESIGQSGPSDVFRWESEIATSRRSAISANALRNVAEIALNRVLNRPLEEPFDVDRVALGSPEDLFPDNPYLIHFRDKMSFARFRAFMVEEGLSISPELRQLDASIAAAQRGLSAASRAFTLPTLGIVGSVNRILDEGGEGAGSAALPGFPEMDDTSWNIGVQLSYPLFTGGGKLAERSRAREEVFRLELRRRAVAERIKQRIRSAAHLSGASYAGIQQALDAAEAAGKNLDLVTDAYSRGSVTIIDLLDAQNAHIVANQGSANAVYGFLIDLIEFQRAVGRFDALMPAEERDDFLNRIQAFMERE